MFTQIAVPIVDLLNQLMGPLLAIVGALGSLTELLPKKKEQLTD